VEADEDLMGVGLMHPGKPFLVVVFALAFLACEKQKEPPADEPALSDQTRQKLGELLIDAARHGEADRVELLLGQGADVRARDTKGETVLHAVFSRRNWRLDLGPIIRLLNAGADLDARDDRGRTPLHAAAERGRREAVELLLDKGADPQDTDKGGQTPLHLAARLANDKAVKLLAARGADPRAGDRSKRTPLHLVEEEDQKETAKLLVSLGADILAEDSFGHSPAGWMVKNCFEELSRALQAGQKVEGSCSTHAELRSYTLLYASVEGHLELARRLIEKGADVNISRSFHPSLVVPGVTPLHGAASGGHLEVARLLIASGARLDAKDKYGRSALEWAIWKKHRKIAEFLRRAGPKPSKDRD
jgi:ankyrin repeat protein